MKVIALFGRGDTGKTHCLGHLINLIYQETNGCNYLYDGQDSRVTLDYLGKRITICTWGDNENEERLNIDKIQEDLPYIAIVATRTKGKTVDVVNKFCMNANCNPPKWVEKYVASFDDKSGQEYLNNLQARQMLDYIKGVIKGQLYYVDSITTINTEENEKRYHLILLGAEMPGEGFPRTLSLELNDNELHYYETGQSIQEDDFVLYRLDSDGRFFNGNESSLAIALRNESHDIRSELSFRESALSFNRGEPDAVKSYHVNVGHGNCSLVLLLYGKDYELWMVDCSTYDYLIRRDYSHNLYHCLADISKQLGIATKDLRISRFMLTHTHFDHYNGLMYLMRHGFVDKDTVIYANLYYDCASPVWSVIIKEMLRIGCGFVEPTASTVFEGPIRVYHPECRLIKKGAGTNNIRVVSQVNNSSVVYGISLGVHLMVFPGDLEKLGFEKMSGAGTCSSYLYKADYYIVSHHGSINGHPVALCRSHIRFNATPLDCASHNLKKAILMGRNNAYSGIYNSVVTGYWSGLGCLEYTERSPHYLELEWKSGTVWKR